MAAKKLNENALEALNASQAVLAWASAGVEASSAGLNPSFARTDPLGAESRDILWRWGKEFPAQAERFALEVAQNGGDSDLEMMSGFVFLASRAGIEKKLPFDVEWVDGEPLRVDLEEWRFPSERMALRSAWVFDEILEGCQNVLGQRRPPDLGLALVEEVLPVWNFYWARNGTPSYWAAIESMAMQSMEADALRASIPELLGDAARKPRL